MFVIKGVHGKDQFCNRKKSYIYGVNLTAILYIPCQNIKRIPRVIYLVIENCSETAIIYLKSTISCMDFGIMLNSL